ncbi:shikimate kinase [Pedobacter sp. MC2016-14]|uniref:shikimate kinase n=1 Tax=Pedobacter sp. MC2016-14 TaxID=2897327 RepID=UPI001E52280C|nr:shikimate kinase [Pedobacter sp. MC2016-14]MCD0486643.1 shikimate kinase [Pedobacter sp. MC2016-14]
MKIFLIGFMGCGKTTMGKKLAKTLEYPVIDLDHEIEKVTGMPVSAYFAKEGEPAFRALESKLLKEFNYPDHCVVATGGGTPCFYDNMEWMTANGTSVYIQMPALALAKRLENGKEKRPLLRDLDEAGIVDFITQKLLERDPFYTKAKVIVNGLNLSPELLKQAIFQL